MTTPLSVTYSVSEAQFIAACHALWAHRAVGPWGNRIIGLLVSGCGAFLIWQGVPGFWGWFFIAVGIGTLLMDQWRDQLWRRFYRGHPKYPGPIVVTFDDGGVQVSSGEGDNHVTWNQFRHHAVADDYLYLIIDQRQFSVIPRAAFDNHAHRNAVEDLVARNLKRLPRRWL